MHVFLLQLCRINNQIVSLAQRMSALEEHIEQLNDRMKDLEEKLEDNHLLLSRQQSTSTDEDTDPDSLTPSYPQTVQNCCATSIFLHGKFVYECPSLSACPLHQDVSPHTYNWHCVVSGRKWSNRNILFCHVVTFFFSLCTCPFLLKFFLAYRV